MARCISMTDLEFGIFQLKNSFILLDKKPEVFSTGLTKNYISVFSSLFIDLVFHQSGKDDYLDSCSLIATHFKRVVELGVTNIFFMFSFCVLHYV